MKKTVKCTYCKRKFEREVKSINRSKKFGYKLYCSKKCGDLSKIKKKKLTCKNCKKKFERTPSGLKRNNTGNFFCGRSCSSTYRNKKRKGKKHPNYTDGESIYRNEALNHYGKKCMVCGYSKCLEAVEAHHMDKNRKNNKLKNLRVLCNRCHTEVHVGIIKIR